MTFNQVVWKMAKYRYKKYVFYLVCNILAVQFFFMFTTVYFNEQLNNASAGTLHALTIPGVALVLFTVFFISYAHHIFMKRRRNEFGLFMTLGMTNRDISRLLIIENGVIAVISLIIGLGTGMIFSKLFFWLLLKIVSIQEVVFQINTKMFVFTISSFLIVFIVVVGQSLYLTMKRNIIENLKSEKITENVSDSNPIIGGIGLFIVIGSIIGLYYSYTGPQGGDLLPLWALATFLGLYIALNQLTSFVISLIKKNKSIYYSRLLYLTNFDYKYKQFTSIMMLVTMMIMVTLLYSTIIFYTYMAVEKEAMAGHSFDVAFIQTENKNNLPVEEIYSVFEVHENNVEEHISVPIYSYLQEVYYGDTEVFSLMSVDAFNEITSSKFELQDDEFIYLLNGVTKIGDDGTPYDNGLHLPSDVNQVLYTLKEVVIGDQVNSLSNLSEVFILNKTELDRLKHYVDGLDATVHLINIENWKESEVAVNKLQQIFKNYNAKTSTINVEDIIPEDDLFRIDSRVDGYHGSKNSNGILFIVTIFLSILFFAGSFLLLYIQLFSEVDKEEQRIRKLYRIGITSKEVERLISQEITTIFMMPTFFGIIIALLYIIAMASDMGGVIANPEIFFQFFLIAGIYLVIQFAFLIYSRRKMFVLIANFKM